MLNYFAAFLVAMTMLRIAGMDVRDWTALVLFVVGTAYLFMWVVGRVWGQEENDDGN